MTPDDPRTDETLARAAADGCRDAFSRLYGRYRHVLAGYLFEHFVRSFDEALEIEDEAWKKAFEHVRAYLGERPFRAWLIAIGRNLALNTLRHKGKAPRPEVIARAFPAEKTPLERLEYRESKDWCTGLVRQLPLSLREPYYLRVAMDFEPRTISELLGVPLSTVRGRLFRARKQIAEAAREWSSLFQE